MLIHSTLLLLLVTPQDTPKADTAADRARRAAIVDRIMAEPPPPRAARAAPVEDPPPPPAPPAVVVRQAVVMGRQGQAQKQITLEMKETAQVEDGEEVQPALRAMPLNFREMALSKENFDRWVFDETNTEKARRDHLHSLLSGKIVLLEIRRGLNPEQSEKLRLAGSGDIKRFFDRVEESRREFEAVRKDFNAGRLALNRLEPLASEYQVGPFGPDSFLEKTLRKIETDARGPGRGEK